MIPWLVTRRRAGVLIVTMAFAAAAVAACGPGSTPSPTLAPLATLRPSPSRSTAPASPSTRPSPTRASTPVVTAAPTTPPGQAYTVQKGDTLVGIAAKFGITVDALRAANPQVTDPTKLQIGQVLTIPPK